MVYNYCIDCGKKKSSGRRPRCRVCGAKRRHLDYPPKCGSDHFAWKGGRRLNHDGYVLVNVPLDSEFLSMAHRANKNSVSYYVLEHRLVVAQQLGRCLEEDEIVHHRNGIRDDNVIENLELLSSKHDHSPNKALEQRVSDLEVRIIQLEAENILLKSGELVWK